MPSLPLVKLNDHIRINLFNITYIDVLSQNAKVGASDVMIYFAGGSETRLVGQEAQQFVEFFDSVCEDIRSRPTTRGEQPPREGNLMTDRNFGDLLHSESSDPPTAPDLESS